MLCITERIGDIDNTLATFDRALEESRRHYGRLHPSDVELIDMFLGGIVEYKQYFSEVGTVLGAQGYPTRSLSYLEAFTRPELPGCVAGNIRIVQPFLVDTERRGRGRVGFMAYAGVGYSRSSQPPSFSTLRRDDASVDMPVPSHFVGLWSPDLGEIVKQCDGDIAEAILKRGRA